MTSHEHGRVDSVTPEAAPRVGGLVCRKEAASPGPRPRASQGKESQNAHMLNHRECSMSDLPMTGSINEREEDVITIGQITAAGA